MPLLDTLDDALQHGKVLLHCRAGVNRSPAVAVAYAMKKRDMTLQLIIRNMENRKQDQYPDQCWDTLTNTQFLRFLENWK
jgi:protein-tyrosine phosphatase